MGYAMKQREGETKQKRKGARGRVEERKTGGEGRLAAESWLGYADWDGWVD